MLTRPLVTCKVYDVNVVLVTAKKDLNTSCSKYYNCKSFLLLKRTTRGPIVRLEHLCAGQCFLLNSNDVEPLLGMVGAAI